VDAKVADDLAAKYPAAHITDALEVLPTRQATNPAGWLVRAITDAWQLHDEAERLRAVRASHEQQLADARAAEDRQQRRDEQLAGWAREVSAALTDEQLTDVVARVTQPVAGIDRRSAPVAVSQILAWAIHAAAAHPDRPIADALHRALGRANAVIPAALPPDLPEPLHATAPADQHGPDVLRRRVALAIAALERDEIAPRARPVHPELGGDALT
jgi:hypothetical protein